MAENILQRTRNLLTRKQVPPTNGKVKREEIEQLAAPTTGAPFWFIQKVLRRYAHTMLYGDDGTAKSGLAYETALRMTYCQDWFGFGLVHGYVVLVAGEGREDFDQMEKAFRKEYGLSEATYKVLVLTGHYEIDKEHDMERLKKAIVQAIPNPEKKKAHELGVNLIIFDTLATCSDGAEDSSPKMARVRTHMRDLHRHFACSTLIVHHIGKDARLGARGKSIIRKDADLMLYMEKVDDTHVQATIKKQKGGKHEGWVFEFERKVLDVLNDDGTPLLNNWQEPVTTYLLKLKASGQPQPQPTPRDILLTLLFDAGATKGKDLMHTSGLTQRIYMQARDELLTAGLIVEDVKDHNTHWFDLSDAQRTAMQPQR